MERVWKLQRGAEVLADGSVRFSVWAPKAKDVSVRLLTEAGESDHELEADENGLFQTVVKGIPPGTDYSYRIGGESLRPDPVSRYQPQGVHGPSRVVDPAAFSWTDGAWKGLEVPDLVLYELHVGTYTEQGTFDALIEHLPYLKDLGVTAIELMPIAEFPGARNWGYDGVSLYAPQSTYGGPEGLRRLVDAAHRSGLAVALDVVYNHFGPEGNYLGEFGPYFTDRYRTPWGQAVNYDDAESDEVRRYIIENALYWITEYHLDGLRLDAVHAIFDFGAEHLLAELAEAVHRQGRAMGRRAFVIAESDLNDPRLIRPRERGGYALDAQWSDDFHHALHVTLTGERTGYYSEFDGVGALAKSLQERYVFNGIRSPHRRRRHGAPARDVSAQRFVVFTQNHDQVGNRARGERLSNLVGFEGLKLAASALLLSPYVPMLFMGEEYGETNPFLYFVSHTDPQLVEAVREGRKREFAAFDWAGEVPDPQSEETFARSRLSPRRPGTGQQSALHRLHRDLLRLRRQQPALRPGAARVQVWSDPQAEWIVLLLQPSGGRALLTAFNFAKSPGSIDLPLPARDLQLLLSTEDILYDGSGAQLELRQSSGSLRLELPQQSAVLLSTEAFPEGAAPWTETEAGGQGSWSSEAGSVG